MADLMNLVPGLKALGINAAGNQQRNYLNTAMQRLQKGYGDAQATQAPIYQGSLGIFQDLLGKFGAGELDPRKFDFQQDPGYQFALNEGIGQIKNQGAAMGEGHAPATTKALIDFATGKANQTYNDAFTRNMQGMGAMFNMGQSLSQPYLLPSAQNISNLQTGLAGSLADIEAQKGGISGQLAASPYFAAAGTAGGMKDDGMVMQLLMKLLGG